MNVDGTTPKASAVPGPQISIKRTTRDDRTNDPEASRERPQVGVSENGSAAVKNDRFEHIETNSDVSVTYRDDAHGDGRVPRGTFDTVQEAIAETYSAEIVDLETAVNATGLPLISKEDNPGVLKQDILRAYREESGDKNSVNRAQRDILDTQG